MVRCFATLSGELHGLTFGNSNCLFVAQQGTKICRLDENGRASLFAEVKNTTGKTHIWNLAWGKDQRLYAAARDRILAFDINGNARTLVEGGFTGIWGACDLRFDPKGAMYVVHGTTLSRYDSALRKENIIAYPLGEPSPPPVLVGLEFDASGSSLYLSYLFMRKVVRFDLVREEGIVATTTVGGLPCPEYIAVDKDGNAYVTQPDANQVVKITASGLSSVAAASPRMRGPNTLAFGRGEFGPDCLYVSAGDSVWQVQLGRGHEPMVR